MKKGRREFIQTLGILTSYLFLPSGLLAQDKPRLSTASLTINKSDKDLYEVFKKYSVPKSDSNYGTLGKFEYDLFISNEDAGKIIFNGRGSRSLEINLNVPFVGYTKPLGWIKGLFGDPFAFKQHISLFKENDSSYIEKLDDQIFKYKLVNNSWFLTYYKGENEKDKDMVEKPMRGEPLVDLIHKRLSGINLENIEFFIFANGYEGLLTNEKSFLNYNKFEAKEKDFYVWEGNKRIAISKDKEVIFKGLSILLNKDNPFLAVLKVEPKFGFPAFNLEIIRKDIS